MNKLLSELGGKNVINIPVELKKKSYEISSRLFMLFNDVHIFPIMSCDYHVTLFFYKKIYLIPSFDAGKIIIYLAYVINTLRISEELFLKVEEPVSNFCLY